MKGVIGPRLFQLLFITALSYVFWFLAIMLSIFAQCCLHGFQDVNWRLVFGIAFAVQTLASIGFAVLGFLAARRASTGYQPRDGVSSSRRGPPRGGTGVSDGR